MLRAGERQFRTVPPERWDHSLVHTPEDRRARAGTYTDQIATIDGVDQFDARYYRMSPRRVRYMDPQHRLLMDASREALQDAGWERRSFDRENTGVFFGLNISEYVELVPDVRTMQAATLPGILLNMAAADVSQFFDLHGPSFAVDAACSATLVALHQALGHLASGECKVALVGGAYLAIEPRTLLAFSKVGAVSEAGVCRPFDKDADGFVLGDGVGVVVLRPLEEALAAGDRIYAVIRGIGSSNDGTSGGPMTPRAGGQLTALRRAYSDAGFSPRSVGFFEAHGTATTVGDAAELDAITRLLTEESSGEADGQAPGAYLSSVKSLVGHSLGASGAASLIKTALMLHQRTITPMPPTNPARAEDLAAAGLRLPHSVLDWEHDADHPRRAGISNFGFGGTNVHVVLEEAPEPSGRKLWRPGAAPAAVEETAPTNGDRPQLFVFSAGSVARLESYLVRFLETLHDSPDMPLAAIARTLAGRELLTARLTIVASDMAELRSRVQQARSALAQGQVGMVGEGAYAAAEPLPEADRGVAFVFPGQGSQRPGMVRDLYERFPELAATVDSWDSLASAEENGFSLLDAVHGPESATPEGMERLTGTDVCQPVLGTFGVAVSRFLRSIGAKPAVSLGHSVGEFPAAVTAGALEDDECLRLLLTRGSHMRRAESIRSGGRMLAVQASRDEVAKLAEGIEEAWPACFNHSRQTVYSGTAPALEELAQRCTAAGVTTNALQVSNGFHSPLLDPVRDDLQADIAARTISGPSGVLVSSVSGEIEDDPEKLRELWGKHASVPVRFQDAVSSAYEAGARIFVQVCGGGSILGAARRSVPDATSAQFVALTGEGPDEARTFLAAIGRLVVAGVDIDPTMLVAEEAPLVSLPPSPLAATSHWFPMVASRVPAPPTVPGLAAVLEGSNGVAGGEADGTSAASAPAVNGDTGPTIRPVTNGASAPVVRDSDFSTPPRAARPGSPAASQPAHNSSREDSLVNDVVSLLHKQLNVLQTLGLSAPQAEDAQSVDLAVSALATAGSVAQPRARAMAALELEPAGVSNGLPLPVQRSRSAAELGGVAPQAAPSAEYERVRDSVYAELSAVSAFPTAQLHDGLGITQELGFDSLMVTELLERLRRSLPEAAQHLNEGFLPAQATIGQAVELTAQLLGVASVNGHAPQAQVVIAESVNGSAQPAAPEPAEIADPASTVTPESRVEDFPELLEMEQRAVALGDRNPYFLLHEGTMRDTTRVDGKELITFSGYNYLGLSGHPKVAEAVKEAVDRYGTSVSASRFLSGDRPLHRELESELAALNGSEAAIALVSGHATNVTVIGHLVGPGDLILHDALAHDSILQGCKLSGARRRPFPHNDMAALDDLLKRLRHLYRRVLIVVEGVYSMDGDIVDLPALIEVKERHGAIVMIDEAHSIGVVGATGGGVGEYFGVDRTKVDLWSGTLSKSLAGCGGYVAGSRRLVDYLKFSTPGYVYSVGMTPANAAASLAAIRVMHEEPERLQRLRDNSALFLRLAKEAGIDTGDSFDSPVIPAIIKDSQKSVLLAAALFDHGVSANPILHPAVAEDLTRLRFFVTSEHSAEQIEYSVATLTEQWSLLNK